MPRRILLIAGGVGLLVSLAPPWLAAPETSIARWLVTIVGRDPGKGRDTVRNLRADTQNQHIFFEPADLSFQDQIRDLARRVQASHDRLDVLVNNIGGLLADRWDTGTGIEATLALSHLAGFQLTTELRWLLVASALAYASPNDFENGHANRHEPSPVVAVPCRRRAC